MNVSHLSCAACHQQYAPHRLYNLCQQCAKPLLVHYNLASVASTLRKENLATRAANLWRYREVLPVEGGSACHHTGEKGGRPCYMPLTSVSNLACPSYTSKTNRSIRLRRSKPEAWRWLYQWPKNSGSPNWPFPSAGNAASALAAYAAQAGLGSTHLYAP